MNAAATYTEEVFTAAPINMKPGHACKIIQRMKKQALGAVAPAGAALQASAARLTTPAAGALRRVLAAAHMRV